MLQRRLRAAVRPAVLRRTGSFGRFGFPSRGAALGWAEAAFEETVLRNRSNYHEIFCFQWAPDKIKAAVIPV